jgi:signal transduction histidine kinase
MATEIQTGNSILRPRARLIKTIGEDLISSDVVAVMELVKNSYDADASIISIRFEGPVVAVQIDKKRSENVLTTNGSSITISDDGKGMSLATIQTAWMEPATVAKKIETNSPGKSRRYTGEKGIGRFASAKLSSALQIVTKELDDNEVVVTFDWTRFSNDDQYLDEVSTDWEVRAPQEIIENGTILRLKNLNAIWNAERIRDLRVALSRLVNPVAPITDFLIELMVPGAIGDYSGLVESPESISHPDYSIKGSVNSSGLVNFKYKSRKVTDGTPQTMQLERDSNPVIPFNSGPFNFEFRVWDRETDSLERLAKEVGTTTKNVKSDLNELAGVSIYRDKFRVLPYGDPKNDWLRLNARRINNPTMRISDNQIVGYISITRDGNPNLTDQSNREGIIESSSFNDLQEQIKLILNELEVKRYAERPRRDDPTPNSLYSAFSVAPIAEAVSRKLPQDKEVLELVKQTQEKIDEGVKKVQEVLSRYRRLSTLGILIDSVLHDGGHFLLNIDSEVRLLEIELKREERDEKAILAHVVAIQDQRKVMAQLFKRIEPFGGRRKGRPASIIIERSIRNVFDLSNFELKRQNISVELPDSENTVTIDDTELQMIIVNLLQNSIHWLGKVTDRRIVVQIERAADELSLIFSDSGPGVPEDKGALIFDPYFTTREDGVGLGLTIVGEIVSEYNGDFYLVNNGPLDGATFKIVFRRRI